MIILYISIGFFLAALLLFMCSAFVQKMGELQIKEWALNQKQQELIELDAMLTEHRDEFEQEIRRKLLAENKFN